MTASMQEATALYDAAASLALDRICVEDEGFRRLSLAVRELRSRLGDDSSDSYWRPVLARLVRLRWELATVPLPFRHPAFGLRETAAFLSDRLRSCERVFPAHAGAAQEITALLQTLVTSDADPLGGAVRQLAWTSTDRALILRDSRHAATVANSLACPGNVSVLAASQLAGSRVYGEAAVIGPTCWFPRQVFGAPRARGIHIVQYAWLSDPSVDTRLFSGSQMGSASRSSSLPPYGGDSSHGVTLASADLRPSADWVAIASSTGGRTAGPEDRLDTVDAYLLLLASEQAVYLEAEEGSRAYVVELGFTRELHMVATRSIQPGTYVVNRVGGEGDYIPAIADSLLGDEAQRLRASQARWKGRLGDLIRSAGAQAALTLLEAAGSPRASRSNLRRWASGTSIRTEDYADFAALMDVLGLGAEAEEVWEQMNVIDQAHLRAGQRVRALLNREILKGDTRELEARGWQDYDVEEIEGEGSLRVARVEARAPATVRVGTRQTRQLRPVDRDLWQV